MENASLQSENLREDEILSAVEEVLAATPVIDMHTHLFAPAFGKLGLWGIDDLLTYHYLEAEFFRSSDVTQEDYWSMGKQDRADAIWRVLFVENTPISEATRGVIAVLQAFNLPTESSDLVEARELFRTQSAEAHIRKVCQMAGVNVVVMTNDPLDSDELPLWMNGIAPDPQFYPALRLDRILCEWSEPWEQLAGLGYAIDGRASGRSIAELRRFLHDWYQRMRPLYMAVSLPDTFEFPAETPREEFCAKPYCRPAASSIFPCRS